MRSTSRPPPSYELSMRSSTSRPCPSATSTSASATSEDRHVHHVHRHHRHHHHHHGSRTKVTVRSATATASASTSTASPQPSTSRREDRKRSNPENSEASASKEVKKEEQPQQPRTASSPQPGPSGLQRPGPSRPTTSAGLNAPDLQLDCLSSDSDEDGLTEEDVTVVKISRRRKGTSKKRVSTTTINAPPGSIVEVDLTQESDPQEDEDDDDIRVDAIRPRSEVRGEGLIKLRQFATVPHLPPNVQSRGSTPSTTPAPGTSASDMYEAANPYLEPHSHPCNGECGLFHCPPPPPDYRPRRLRQPYHHQVGCQDAHCRNHHRPSASTSASASASASGAASTSTSTEQQPLDCRYVKKFVKILKFFPTPKS